jgi:PKD repeat protein
MTSNRVYGAWFALTILLALAAPLRATTIVMPTDQELIAKSDVIVRGTVVSSQPVEVGSGIWTETILAVDETLKGNVSSKVTIREVGGKIGDREVVVFGSPDYTPGETVLAFLWASPRGHFQTMDLFVGKFSEEWTIDGQRLWHRPMEVANTELLGHDFEPIEVTEVQRDAAGFSRFIRDRVAGRPGLDNYGVASPALVRNFQSNFALIAEPTIYRWFSFEDGKTVEWKGVGSQPGYSDGGIAEARTAMSSWTGYSDANIRYAWGGMSSSAPGGLEKANGINEVMFNDPLDEIAGTWTGQGGVVGRGGFNRISGSRSWTSTFNASGTHTQRTWTAYDIIEGNLVIQDGISPSTGISSDRLAEILAHEFGHTLGFGHSADNKALMYATVTGLGPSLRDDDRLAARWLYPAKDGSGTLEIPAAPSNLTVQALSSTTARLSWKDNSGVETSQTIYGNGGSGFVKAATVGANVTSADIGGLTSGKSYSFRITASNSAGESSPSNTASITMPSDAVQAAFAVSPTSGTAGSTTFSFSDQSSGPVATWQWNFGDGTGSTARNPSKLYQNAATYTVSLTVRGSDGQQSTASRSVTVNAPAPSVVAAFDVSSATVVENEQVSFYDRSSGSPTWWQWNFGDGKTSATRNPVHAYAKAGTYTVTLTSGNASGSSSASRTISVSRAEIGFRSLIPVSTTVQGVGGTSWRTSLTIFNASSFSVPVDVVYLPAAGEMTATRRVTLAAGRSVSWNNVLGELFGMANGAGALHFETSSTSGTPDLRISSRTYTEGTSGTYGQFVGDLRGHAVAPRLHLAGLANSGGFRTNIGLVNRGSAAVSPTLSLYASNGSLLGRTTVALAPGSFSQQSLNNLFPVVASAPQSEMSLEVHSPVADAVTAYASIIDNISHDPVFVSARPAESDREIYIGAVGRTGGVSGTYWRSDVTLHNPGASSIFATVRFLRAGEDNRSVAGRTISIGARNTRTIGDIMSWLGAGEGSGALQIVWTGSSEGVVATSRTYTTRGSDGGTLGQAIGMTAAREFGDRAIVTGLASDSRFRTNLGLVNSGDSAIGVTLRLVAPDGRQLATAFVTVPARSQVQAAAANLFTSVSFANLGNFTVVAETPARTMYAYGSVIDNQSGDPIFISGR